MACVWTNQPNAECRTPSQPLEERTWAKTSAAPTVWPSPAAEASAARLALRNSSLA
jgi:hypothetical protein